MLSPTVITVLGLLVVLGVVALGLSIAMLRRRKLYQRLSPEARPRRWVLISLLVLFTVFIVWFPVWMTWPDTLISRILLGPTFGVVGLTLKWLSPLVDGYIRRRVGHSGEPIEK